MKGPGAADAASYDYLIVGCGLFGATFARLATDAGKRCLVIDRRPHIGGNCYTENIEGINVHRYGAHIFHTSNKAVWNFVHRFAEFNNYINSPKAISGEKLYSLPFNMNTFYELWQTRTPAEARREESSRSAFEASRPTWRSRPCPWLGRISTTP